MTSDSIVIEYKELGECIDLVIDHRGKTPRKLNSDWVEEGIPTISAKNVNSGKLVAQGAIRYVTPEIYRKWMKEDVQPGDCFLVSEGATLGECLYWDNDYPIVLGQRIFCIRTNPNILYSRYFYAYMISTAFQSEITGRATGSSVPGLRQTEVLKLKVKMLPMDQQIFIGDLLYKINKKVKQNTEANQTLEQIAQAIFKSWFVDFEPVKAKGVVKQKGGSEQAQSLAAQAVICGAISLEQLQALDNDTRELEAQLHSLITQKPSNEANLNDWTSETLQTTADLFPNALVESELGEIPEGWGITTVGSLLKVTKGRSYKSVELKESNTALVTLKSFMRGGGYREDGLKEYTGTYKPEQVIEPGELVMSLTDVTQAAEIVGKPAIVTRNDNYERLVASLDVAILRANESSMKEFFYGLMSTYSFHRYAESYATGTTVLHLNAKGITSYEFAMPNIELCKLYGDVTGPMLNKHEGNIHVSRSLEQLRDALLPKLLSGKLTTGSQLEVGNV